MRQSRAVGHIGTTSEHIKVSQGFGFSQFNLTGNGERPKQIADTKNYLASILRKHNADEENERGREIKSFPSFNKGTANQSLQGAEQPSEKKIFANNENQPFPSMLAQQNSTAASGAKGGQNAKLESIFAQLQELQPMLLDSTAQGICRDLMIISRQSVRVTTGSQCEELLLKIVHAQRRLTSHLEYTQQLNALCNKLQEAIQTKRQSLESGFSPQKPGSFSFHALNYDDKTT